MPPPYPGNTTIPDVCGDLINSGASRQKKKKSLTSSRDGEERTDPPTLGIEGDLMWLVWASSLGLALKLGVPAL